MKRLKIVAPVLAITFFASLLTASVLPSFAAGGGSTTMSLSPTNGTYNVGNSFTVTITENSSTVQINSVEADLTYNASDLTLTGISTAGGFGIAAYTTPIGSANGSLSIQLGSTTPLTGSQTVATVTFKATNISTSSVSFANTSQVLASSDNSNTLGTTTGSSYNVIASTCPTGQTGTPPNCVTPSAPTTPTTPSTPVTTVTKPTASAPKSSSTTTTNITPKGSSTPVSVASGSQVQVSAPATIAPGTSTTTTSDTNAPETTNPITKVEYYLNDKLIDTQSSEPFSYKLDTSTILNGTYTLTTKTYYTSGEVTTSSQRLVVKNPLSLTQIGLVSRHYALPNILILVLLLAVLVYILRRENLLSVWKRRRLNQAINGPSSAISLSNDKDVPFSTIPTNKLPTPGHVISPVAPTDSPSDDDKFKPTPGA